VSAQHTQGEWEAQLWSDNAAEVTGWCFVVDGHRLPLSEMEGDADEAEANARLMAASPKLLAACKAFSALYGHLFDSADHLGAGFLMPEAVKKYDAVHSQMSEAIEKATGRTS